MVKRWFMQGPFAGDARIAGVSYRESRGTARGSEGSCRRLVRTGGAVIYRLLHGRDEIRTVEGGKGSTVTRIPAPADKIILGNVFHDLNEGAIAVFGGILELAAKLARSFSLNDHFHFGRGQRPFRISGRHIGAGQIGILMAGMAGHGVKAGTVGTTVFV